MCIYVYGYLFIYVCIWQKSKGERIRWYIKGGREEKEEWNIETSVRAIVRITLIVPLFFFFFFFISHRCNFVPLSLYVPLNIYRHSDTWYVVLVLIIFIVYMTRFMCTNIHTMQISLSFYLIIYWNILLWFYWNYKLIYKYCHR